ncbi:uncharacterized protein LOC127290216 [Leptopilina boulardi]|uniref:uncharacterized protein LOC127290216 n=1 Tax=Leptopilina boulardi TaxID=63433 RepID=UPI0021F65FE4|nr:uncharacterized protein LOC127290216 [Leptopilina boulardi]
MFLESILSTSFLLLASGSSIYVLGKNCHDQYSTVKPFFISASIGIFGFCVRSLSSLIYNLFFRIYPIDPQEIEDEWKKKEELKKRPFRNYSIFYRFSSTLAQGGLIYAVFNYHKCEIFETFVLSLTIVEFICALEARKYNQENTEVQSFFEIFAKNIDNSLDFYWIFIGGYFGWFKRNSFCILAFLPYTISILTLTSDEFDKNPNIQIGFNDYMTTAYILLMTEAIRYFPE